MSRARTPQFDPQAPLSVLDRHRVAFVVIGGLARVIEGTDEIAGGVDITLSTRRDNLRRLGEAPRSSAWGRRCLAEMNPRHS